MQPPKVQKTAQDNAFLGTLVAIQNNLDAPLAPFGRKMNSWLDPNSEVRHRLATAAQHSCYPPVCRAAFPQAQRRAWRISALLGSTLLPAQQPCSFS